MRGVSIVHVNREGNLLGLTPSVVVFESVTKTMVPLMMRVQQML